MIFNWFVQTKQHLKQQNRRQQVRSKLWKGGINKCEKSECGTQHFSVGCKIAWCCLNALRVASADFSNASTLHERFSLLTFFCNGELQPHFFFEGNKQHKRFFNCCCSLFFHCRNFAFLDNRYSPARFFFLAFRFAEFSSAHEFT